jgi:hypothetical protein
VILRKFAACALRRRTDDDQAVKIAELHDRLTRSKPHGSCLSAKKDAAGQARSPLAYSEAAPTSALGTSQGQRPCSIVSTRKYTAFTTASR